MTFDLARIRHVVLDLDGTLYRGDRLFEVTIPFLARLSKLGIGHTFPHQQYVEEQGRLRDEAARGSGSRRGSRILPTTGRFGHHLSSAIGCPR